MATGKFIQLYHMLMLYVPKSNRPYKDDDLYLNLRRELIVVPRLLASQS
jgi:hypothetical protein